MTIIKKKQKHDNNGNVCRGCGAVAAAGAAMFLMIESLPLLGEQQTRVRGKPTSLDIKSTLSWLKPPDISILLLFVTVSVMTLRDAFVGSVFAFFSKFYFFSIFSVVVDKLIDVFIGLIIFLVIGWWSSIFSVFVYWFYQSIPFLCYMFWTICYLINHLKWEIYHLWQESGKFKKRIEK